MLESILVTGGSGFVGQNIIRKLLQEEKKYNIYNLSRSPLNLPGVIDLQCNAENFDLSELHSKNFDYIIHTLALSNDKYCQDLDNALSINVEFTYKLLTFAKQQSSLKKFIYISSIIIYDDKAVPPVKEDAPLRLTYTNYSFTKGLADEYARFFIEKQNLPGIIFRLANIYGPYQSFNNSPFLVPSKIVQALTEGEITVFDLDPRRDWIYSEDAAEAIIQSLDVPYSGILNLASGEGKSVEDIVKVISSELNVPYRSLQKKTNGPQNFYCSIEKIKQNLNWEPKTQLKDGMKKTIEYIKKNRSL